LIQQKQKQQAHNRKGAAFTKLIIHLLIEKEKLVEPRGGISNHSATDELARVCAMIEEIQAIGTIQQANVIGEINPDMTGSIFLLEVELSYL
jgi:hypothetical protein